MEKLEEAGSVIEDMLVVIRESYCHNLDVLRRWPESDVPPDLKHLVRRPDSEEVMNRNKAANLTHKQLRFIDQVNSDPTNTNVNQHASVSMAISSMKSYQTKVQKMSNYYHELWKSSKDHDQLQRLFHKLYSYPLIFWYCIREERSMYYLIELAKNKLTAAGSNVAAERKYSVYKRILNSKNSMLNDDTTEDIHILCEQLTQSITEDKYAYNIGEVETLIDWIYHALNTISKNTKSSFSHISLELYIYLYLYIYIYKM